MTSRPAETVCLQSYQPCWREWIQLLSPPTGSYSCTGRLSAQAEPILHGQPTPQALHDVHTGNNSKTIFEEVGGPGQASRSLQDLTISIYLKRIGVLDCQTSAIYQIQQVSITSFILTLHDPVIQHAATLAIRREDLHRPAHKPMLEVIDIWRADPCASRKSLLKRVKGHVTMSDTGKRLEHVRGLQHQGQLLHATDDKASQIWSSAVASATT